MAIMELESINWRLIFKYRRQNGNSTVPLLTEQRLESVAFVVVHLFTWNYLARCSPAKKVQQGRM